MNYRFVRFFPFLENKCIELEKFSEVLVWYERRVVG